MNPYDAAHMLAKALKESPDYTEYKNLKEKVNQQESTRKMLKDFRKKQFGLQTRQMTGQEVPEAEVNKLQDLQNVLLQNPLVGPFLHAEYKLTQTLNDVYKIIGEAVELGMEEEMKELSEELKQEAADRVEEAKKGKAEQNSDDKEETTE